jgi:dTDP-4-dehydrorhamnose 3,5-epimerase
MHILKTEFPDLYILEPKVFDDPRGYFYESYNAKQLEEKGINIIFRQDNQSKSSYGVLRGLHYQLNPSAQTKLIRTLEGKIWDVVVDIRKGSPTFGKWMGIELSSDNKKQFLIPQGFAHGFSVLSETAVVMYKCDNFYNPQSERGIIYDDPELGIDWKIPVGQAILSPKDKLHPTLKNADINFQF